MNNRSYGSWRPVCMGAVTFLSAVGCVFAENLAEGLGLVEALHGGNAVHADAAPFRVDTSIISGNYSARNGNAIDRSGPNCWGPEAVYQCETWSATFAPIIIRDLVPGATYVVECHNTEAAFGNANHRVFSIKVNGDLAVENLDMLATYGRYVACCIQKATTAKDDGTIEIAFVKNIENPRIGGVAVWGASAPGAIGAFTATKNASALDFAWSTATDTLRYYIQKAESETGPWTDLGEYVRMANAASIDGCFDPSKTQCYRVAASNGVGVVTSPVVTFSPDDVTYTDIATRGETIPNDATANLRILTVTGKRHNPQYSSEALATMNSWIGEYNRLVAAKELDTPEAKKGYFDDKPIGRMTEQDPAIFAEILSFIGG